MLELSSLKKAIKSLQEALDEYDKNSNDFMRDSCIQRFEYTYELSWKMLKRHLELTAANPAEIDELSFQELIRKGCEKGLLLGEWSDWKLYRIARGTTSHAYDENKAEEVFAVIPAFLKEAEHLYLKLNG